MLYIFFFKQKTAYEMRISDWSSDVCSSDLQEGAGAALVERAELVNVLQDRPELDAVARHQAHRPLDGFETAQRGKFIEQEQDGAGRGGRRAREIGQSLRQLEAQPTPPSGEPLGRPQEQCVGNEGVSTRRSRWAPYT